MKRAGSGTLVPPKVNQKDGAKAPFPKTELQPDTTHTTKILFPNTTNISGSGTSVPPKLHTHLPHIDLTGHYQFITFRTYESTDNYLNKLASSHLSNPKKQQLIDNYLDTSNNGNYLHAETLSFLYRFLKSKDQKHYELICFCIMSNHVHLLVKPLIPMDKMIRKIKGNSAKAINELLSLEGKFWTSDYYDKMIRDEKHFNLLRE